MSFIDRILELVYRVVDVSEVVIKFLFIALYLYGLWCMVTTVIRGCK